MLQDYEVQIPIIQRDYAQGRKSQKEIRHNFLKALQGCLNNSEPIKLDFIYGSVIEGKFQPLDGQQRLTTLFLLHWYAATKDGVLSKPEVCSILEKFSYETRISSREFCKALVEESISEIRKEHVLSESIIDENWFYLSWVRDPTIDAMLRTIDAIHKIFFDVDRLFDKISSDLIQFYFVELENLGLTDDLYIKMNARGKLLTPFENFKAGFQKRIDEENWEEGKDFAQRFSTKIDNDWTDFFWDHFRKEDTIDAAQTRFVAAITMIMHSVERFNSTETRVELINQLQEEPSQVRPTHFTKRSFNYLISAFNAYNERVVLTNYLNERLPFPMWRHTPKSSFLSMIVYEENSTSTIQRDSATYTQKVLFFAESVFFKKNDHGTNDIYEDWMRVIRNIVSRADIDKDGSRPDIVRSPQSFDGVINLINELSEGCDDIYQFLASDPSLKSQYARDQINEEIIKAKLITHDINLKETIFNAEDNELLRGKISFLFHCIDYDLTPNNFNVDAFVAVTNVIDKHFDNEKSLNNDIRRAMLTIEVNGIYEFYSYWWSYWHIGQSTKRRLFDRFREIEYCINHEYYREYFKNLTLKLINKSPSQIAEEFISPLSFPNWKLRLIKEKNILDEFNRTNHIAIAEDNSHCFILKSKRPREIEGNLRIE
ncbi:GmrSD restriction endonuclease domain-containing protein [Flagellimonas taeanensis]|uniref:GmrSD restriction endonuclease domain-containing protein n=1 Tax=Flagellimonas taeanensis TaxID=1005926 RepID=UPI001C435A77|nr:DUF262 domain-containing protein [Allomuricauda taeanensis]